MFVSVVLDPGNEGSARELAEVLAAYGFEKVQRACWESSLISEQILAKVKNDIDRVTDYYDSIRIYQFPIDGAFAVTVLSQKKWKRIVIKPPVPRPAGRKPGQAGK
ncbi:CRISPR-associated endonuclease Cas2 [Brucepastera parasyntrophica]|uniref:CRISPR-associated endonuclease Cas2 n=1 Tax=Brucepastera parasyntrophica TaxID=2880008 RepID=UPI00210CDEB9|nr:CRISPR-associated endonuclease Cas2 [Brucepastera parasyntrophica]ULQ59928.1 CRISPR-associated endonuclease Cas2 [Brucepastera parasyntrophica]